MWHFCSIFVLEKQKFKRIKLPKNKKLYEYSNTLLKLSIPSELLLKSTEVLFVLLSCISCVSRW